MQSSSCRRPLTGGSILGLLCVLVAQFVGAQDPAQSGVAVRGELIATGFQNWRYAAMLQISVDGSPLPNAVWKIEGTLRASNGKVQTFEGRVTAKEPGTPVVFEAPLKFPPGPLRLRVTALETTAGQSGFSERQFDWPEPGRDSVMASPVSLLQPVRGAFRRGVSTKGQGALVVGDDDPVRTGLPIALVGVVCRGTSLDELVLVERTLQGAAPIDLGTIRLEPGGEPCAQVRDLIQPGTLRGGFFQYQLRLSTDKGVLASAVREFEAVSGTGS